MNYILLILLLCCIILIGIIIYRNKKYKEKTVEYIKELTEKKGSELKEYFKEETNEFEIRRAELKGELSKIQCVLAEKESRYQEVNQDLETYKKDRLKEIDSAGAEYEKRQRLIVENAVNEYRDLKSRDFENFLVDLREKIDLANEEYETLKKYLEEERSKRAAVNEELRKTEEKERYNEIHSVQLTDNEKEDIHFLLSLENKLHNKQPLYKLIWSTYLQQAYKNTFHNILGNRDPRNVIYCIENINTGKKYIGKTSAEVSKRWTEHIKTSLNIGSVKSTNIHKALYNHWDEFIFYILAETEKEKLSEMEKYYISFYESDKYGYNIKAGG